MQLGLSTDAAPIASPAEIVEACSRRGLAALDVRPVEPRDRYEQIMSAYEELPIGASLELTVDHDPKCMYYTLRATRGDDTFTFDYLENGPETWRVLVVKQPV